MLKDVEITNVKPYTASLLLHHMEDCMYDPKATSNSIVKAQKTWLPDRGFNTKATSAQVLVDYLMVSPDSSFAFLLRSPGMPLAGGAKTGRPKKSSSMRIATKYFNCEVVETGIVLETCAEQYAIARRKVI
jgi:hypothetical protein